MKTAKLICILFLFGNIAYCQLPESTIFFKEKMTAISDYRIASIGCTLDALPSVMFKKVQFVKEEEPKIIIDQCFPVYHNIILPPRIIQEIQVILGGVPAYIGDDGTYIKPELKSHQEKLPFSHRNYENAQTHSDNYIAPLYNPIYWSYTPYRY